MIQSIKKKNQSAKILKDYT